MTDTLHLPSGKMSPVPIHQAGGMTLERCSKPSQAAKFLYLIRENGRPPEWFPAIAVTSPGGLWIPNISEAPNQGEGCSLWRIIEERAPRKYYLTPHLCTKFLRLARKAGARAEAACRYPEPVEKVLLKQGGRMQK